MDLGTCPQCGTPWIEGEERCHACGHVPLGAGLRQLSPKKPNKKKKKYREPGSAIPFLAWLIAFLTLGCLYEYEPWRNDWEMVRVMMGDERSYPLEGVWMITKDISIEAGGIEIDPAYALSGRLEFGYSGDVALAFQTDGKVLQVKGKYSQHGKNLNLSGLEAKGPGAKNYPNFMYLTVEPMPDGSIFVNIKNSEGLFLSKLEGEQLTMIEHRTWRDR